MTAAEFLTELQQHHPPRHDDRVPRAFRIVCGRLPATVHQMIRSERIVAGEVGLDSPEISIQSFEDGWNLIVVHSGLLEFLQYVSIGIFSRISFSGFGEPVLHTDFKDAVRFIADGIWLLRQTGRSPVARGRPHGSGLAIGRLVLSRTQLLSAQVMTVNALSYLIAHELAHLCSGLDGVDDELVADYLGTVMILQPVPDGPTEPGQMMHEFIHLGAQFVHYVFHILERLRFPFAPTHPSAKKRLNFVLEGGRGFFHPKKDDTAPNDEVEPMARLFEHVLMALEHPEDPETAAYHQANAVEVAGSIERVFNSFGNTETLERQAFYAEATRILELGYHHILQESLNALAARGSNIEFQARRCAISYENPSGRSSTRKASSPSPPRQRTNKPRRWTY